MGEPSGKQRPRPRRIEVVDPANPPDPKQGVKYVLPGPWVAEHPEEAAELLVRLLKAQRAASLSEKRSSRYDPRSD